jgi:hypothetical protein
MAAHTTLCCRLQSAQAQSVSDTTEEDLEFFKDMLRQSEAENADLRKLVAELQGVAVTEPNIKREGPDETQDPDGK